MSKPVLTIFYQFDPWNSTIGGIQTIINYFLKYAPDSIDLRVVGVSSDPSVRTGVWHKAEFLGNAISFMPLFTLENDNIRHLVPTTLRYAIALSRQRLESDFLHFHRIEPTLVSGGWTGHKTLFIHNDIRQQMSSNGDKKAILWRYFPSAYYALENKLVKQFDQILSCNSDTALHYQKKYPDLADKISFVRNSVDSECFYPWPKREKDMRRKQYSKQHNLPSDTKYILFAGRLHPQKNPRLLIQAFAELYDPSLHLLIAGDGELFDSVKQQIESLNLSKQVTLLGAVSQNSLADLHRLAEVFVLTSTYEGLPLVVLEALATGTPVVTTNCGETPKLLTKETGKVVTENSPQKIAQAIRQVIDNPEAFTSSACMIVAKPYSAKEVIFDIYSSMIQAWERSLFS